MGFFSDLWKSVTNWIFGTSDQDGDESYGGPRGDWGIALASIAKEKGYRSSAAMKASNPPHYNWALLGRKYKSYSQAYLDRSLAYALWLNLEPGIKPRRIIYNTIIGSRYWKYADEPASAWKRAV